MYSKLEENCKDHLGWNFLFGYVVCVYLVAYERHPAVVGPGEGFDRRVPVINQLDRPASLVLNTSFETTKLWQAIHS